MYRLFPVIAAIAASTGLSAAAAQAPAPAPMTLARAVAIAEKATGGQVLEAEVDTHRGKRVYEVEVVKDARLQELVIDDRGRIVSRSSPVVESYWKRWFHSDRMRALAAARPLSALIGRLEQQTGGEVVEASFDFERGQARYEVEVATRAGVTDVNLDPRTGERLAMLLDD